MTVELVIARHQRHFPELHPDSFRELVVAMRDFYKYPYTRIWTDFKLLVFNRKLYLDRDNNQRKAIGTISRLSGLQDTLLIDDLLNGAYVACYKPRSRQEALDLFNRTVIERMAVRGQKPPDSLSVDQRRIAILAMEVCIHQRQSW